MTYSLRSTFVLAGLAAFLFALPLGCSSDDPTGIAGAAGSDGGAGATGAAGADGGAGTMGAAGTGGGGVCVGPPSGAARASGGDTLCAGADSCSTSTGQPDHLGCPNTCSCFCHDGLCYENSCTAIAGCTEPNVYR